MDPTTVAMMIFLRWNKAWRPLVHDVVRSYLKVVEDEDKAASEAEAAKQQQERDRQQQERDRQQQQREESFREFIS